MQRLKVKTRIMTEKKNLNKNPPHSFMCAPYRSDRGELVASGVEEAVPSVSTFNVLRVPAREQPGGRGAADAADGAGEARREL